MVLRTQQKVSNPNTQHSIMEPFENSVPNAVGIPAKKADALTVLRRTLVLGMVERDMYSSMDDRFKAAETLFAEILSPESELAEAAMSMAFDIYMQSYFLDLEMLMFFFAVATESTNSSVKQIVYNFVPLLRTSAHFLLFARLTFLRRGAGAGLRRAIQAWYDNRNEEDLLYQVLKSKQRYGMSHKDVVFKAHPKLNTTVFNAIMGNPTENAFISAVQAVANPAVEESVVLRHIQQHNISHEMIAPNAKSATVWKALLKDKSVPFHAVLWNLAALTHNGVMRDPAARSEILTRIQNGSRYMNTFDYIKAWAGYKTGRNRNFAWEPSAEILLNLEMSFKHKLQAAAQDFLFTENVTYALDVSGSMTWASSKFHDMNAAEAGAIALYAFSQMTPNCRIVEFDRTTRPSVLNPHMGMWEYVKVAKKANGGATYHASVIDYLIENRIDTTAVVYITDNVTTTGITRFSDKVHEYERFIGHPVKIINVAMTPATYTATFSNNVAELAGFDDLNLWRIVLTEL